MTPPLDLEHAEQPTPVELQSLRRVFQHINTSNNGKLSSGELHDVLVSLGHPTNKQDIELMIWEVDDDLDQYISWDEFLVMYQRCINDATGLEPRKLFNLVQFLMYDRDFTGSISVEQTLQILFVRYGRELLDQVGSIKRLAAVTEPNLVNVRLRRKSRPFSVRRKRTRTGRRNEYHFQSILIVLPRG
eukprot:GHVQ01005064.1.p1 GENE.GHVQ01005064.1~~GHVQ01005064.1.p1  ORF type:complete len:188 (-),score=12.09 GHVQ01005064.1:478-1041(-)